MGKHRHKKKAQLKSPRSIKKVANIIAFQSLQNKNLYKKENTTRKRSSYFSWLMRIVNKHQLINWLYLLAATPFSIFPTTSIKRQKGGERLVIRGRQSQLIRQFVILNLPVWSHQLFHWFCSGCVVLRKVSGNSLSGDFNFRLSQKLFCWKNIWYQSKYVNNCFICWKVLEQWC